MADRARRKSSKQSKKAPAGQTPRPESVGRKATPKPAGAVTLDEARTLAYAKDPTLAAKALPKSAIAPTSPYKVGQARASLEANRKDEIERRVREYKATMAIMKRRGARKPTHKGARSPQDVVAPKAAAFLPLQIFAEGDSWFEYPVPFFGGGIITRLEERLGVPILNLAKAGDEVRYMLGVEQRRLIRKHLKQGCPAGAPGMSCSSPVAAMTSSTTRWRYG